MIKINPQKLVDNGQRSVIKKGRLDYKDDLIEINQDIEIEIKISKLDESSYLISAKTNLKPSLTCDRCLESFISDYQINLEQVFASQPEEDELEIDEDGQVDLQKPLVDQLISQLPPKKLCQSDCKGLCQICGQNLNESICDCREEDKGHPELQKLKKLINNK